MVEERGNLKDAENLRSNLLEVHYNMRSRVKYNLTNVLAPLLQLPAPQKYHYWFAIFLEPWYAIEIKGIKTFHQSENVDNKTLFQQMMPKFYEYIMAAEISVHPNIPQILVVNNEEFLYLHKNQNLVHSLSSEAILLKRIGA